mgnify:CR=1 FL=1
MMGFNDEMKKIMLAGIGAVATTVEKSQEVVETLIKKGEITVEQGKVLNEELKRTVKESVSKQSEEKNESTKVNAVLSDLEQLSEEDLKVIKAKLAEME